MTVAIKNNNKVPLVVPTSVRRKAGFRSGEELEFRASGGVITIAPKSQTADDEYTPDQRLAIDARLAEGLADIAARRTYGPFGSAAAMAAHMEGKIATRPKKPKRA